MGAASYKGFVHVDEHFDKKWITVNTVIPANAIESISIKKESHPGAEGFYITVTTLSGGLYATGTGLTSEDAERLRLHILQSLH